MDGIEVRNPRFARYILGNAALETLASGFRWIEGPVWMGDADCLLFQDLPNDRTMRWTEGVGVSVYRSPSNYANGRTRDRQGRRDRFHHGVAGRLDRRLARKSEATMDHPVVGALVRRGDGRPAC